MWNCRRSERIAARSRAALANNVEEHHSAGADQREHSAADTGDIDGVVAAAASGATAAAGMGGTSGNNRHETAESSVSSAARGLWGHPALNPPTNAGYVQPTEMLPPEIPDTRAHSLGSQQYRHEYGRLGDISSHSLSLEVAMERDRQLAREDAAQREILSARAEANACRRELELVKRENEVLRRERELDSRTMSLPNADVDVANRLPSAQPNGRHSSRPWGPRHTDDDTRAMRQAFDNFGRLSLSERHEHRDDMPRDNEGRSRSSSSTSSGGTARQPRSTLNNRVGHFHQTAPSHPLADLRSHTYGQSTCNQHLPHHSDQRERPPQVASFVASDQAAAHGDGYRNNFQATFDSNRDEEQPRRMYLDRQLKDLPRFSGLPEEWPKFIESYRSTTAVFQYSRLENLNRLQKALTGEALRAVDHVLVYSRHVDLVMETLEDAFGQPDTLLRSQFARVQNLPVLDEARLDVMIGPMAITVRNLVMFLDTPASRHRMGDTVLMDGLISKLPTSLGLNWEEAAEHHRDPGLFEFSQWLTNVARRVKRRAAAVSTTMSTTRGSQSKSQSTQQAKSKHTVLHVRELSPSKDVCVICSQTHHLVQCQDFATMSIDDRWAKVIANKLCFRCLRSGHMLPNCLDTEKCLVDGCAYWHNALLHGGQSNRRYRSPKTPTVSDNPNGKRRQRESGGLGQHSTDEQRAATQVSAEGSAVRAQQPKTTTQPANANTPQPLATITATPSRIMTCRKAVPQSPLLFRVVPVTLHGRHGQIKIYALLDEGSALTLMDASLAKELNLEGPSSELNVQWIGEHSTVVRSIRVALQISGIGDGDVRYPMQAHTVEDLTLPTQTVNSAALRTNYSHLRDIPFPEYANAKPRLLIGLDNHHLGAPLHVEMGTDGHGIMATHTRLGWVVYGSDYQQIATPSQTVLHVRCQTDRRYEELDDLVRGFFSTEDFGVKATTTSTESDDVMRARQLLSSTTKRVGDRFETGLLWRSDDIQLPESRGMALNRLRNIEAKMRRDPAFAAQYADQIASYVVKGYARKLSAAEAANRDGRTWYLPHFAASNPNKPNKFRMVFDAAATVDGVSLNSALLAGPDDNPPLTRLLFRFRLGLVGICGDIREMFHQVRIRQSDQNAQRFLWRGGNTAAPVDEYVMEAMTFGSTCSPASAQHVKNVNATEFESQFPAAADAIRHLHYVDDFVASFATMEEAISVTNAVVAIHKKGGFELRGFVSNSRGVMEAFGLSTPDANPIFRLEPEMTPAKILGMTWKTDEDAFVFQTQFSRVHPDVVNGLRRPTKREVLSTSMSVFDPFGLLAEFMLPVKTLMQDLWRMGVGWDEQVPEAIDQRWQEWRSTIARTRDCRVSRCYSPFIWTTSNLQLHVFADASEVAYAAVAYWRVTCGDGVQLAFVAGKSRCAPLKLLSVPRLELQAAVLATRLMQEVRSSHHDLAIARIVMWSDSETVLSWIRSDQRRYKPFVAFRVAEVVESAPASSWRWVPTSLNVADDATRIRRPHIFNPESRWLRGPAWLSQSEETWPTRTSTDTDVAEDELRQRHAKICKLFVGKVSLTAAIDFKHFSTFIDLCRVIAWAKRFAHNARLCKADRQKGELNASEMEAATIAACRLAQLESFPTEIAALMIGKQIASSSSIFALKPYIDEVGVMRVHGRTDAAEELPLSARRPIILPYDHWLTVLVVRHHHVRMAHQLTNATIAAVRQRFWVPRLRALVNSVRAGCPACKIRAAQPSPPVQGQLPRDRVTPYLRPFTSTGMDYFGPVSVTVNRHREKRWIALFTCLTTRAIHLEVAKDLTADSCLVCIRNLCHIRGAPSLIRCDNGTNFVGAHNVLGREPDFFDPAAVKRELACDGIEWRFNCPGNPEAGGAWERLVQSVKRVLSVTLTEQAPHVETLRAYLIEAANLINSRPLTHLPVEPNEPGPITPNHFLIGGPNTVTTPDPANCESLCLRQQWRACRELSRRFWKQWVADYLPELTRRSKHYPDRKQLGVGDIVIVCDANQPRSKWARGRVTRTTTGTDGLVRIAEVRTADSTIKRPVSKLAVLDIISPSQIDSTDGGRDVANFTLAK